MSNIIYYFSGTGNSLAVAQLVSNKLGDTDVVSIIALRENGTIPIKYEKNIFRRSSSYKLDSRLLNFSVV